MELREQLAEAEHEQWIRWAKNLIPELKQLTQFHLPYGDERESGNCHCKTCERIKRWESLMIPYSELTEAQKQQDRDEVPMSLVTAAIEAARKEERENYIGKGICPICGMPMFKNPHPNAGKPNVVPDYVEIGTGEVCIPCTCKSRHRWSERAMKAESDLSQARAEALREVREQFKALYAEYESIGCCHGKGLSDWPDEYQVEFWQRFQQEQEKGK